MRPKLVRFDMLVPLIALSLLLMAIGCSGQPPQPAANVASPAPAQARATAAPATQPAAQGTVLRMAVHQPPDKFDPATLYGNRSIELAQNVFDGLVDIDENMKVVPAIAERWDISGDGLVYTFYLRKDVKFQNGDPVTANDFVYSWNRALDPKLGNPHTFFMTMIKGAEAVTKGEAKEAVGIKALDDYTLQVTLDQPAGYFLPLLTRWPYWVVDRKVVEQAGDKWTDPPNIVGTGAYRLAEAITDQQYVFVANPNYFGGKPKIDRVEVSVVPEATTQMVRYEGGEFDAIFNLAPAEMRRVQADPNLKAQFGSKAQLRTTWLGMLNSKAPFNNQKLRLALNYAIDKDALVKVALSGQGTPAQTFLPPGLPGYVGDKRQPLPFDPQKAKSLLAEAGFPNGQGLPPLKIYFAASTEDQKVFEFVQAQLQENLGLNVDLASVPAKEFTAMMKDPKQRPFLFRGSFGLDYPDAQEQLEYLATTGSSENREEFANADFDALIKKANVSSDQAERTRLYEQAENLYLDQAPIVPLYYPIVTWVAKPQVKNFGFTPLYLRKWATMSIER